MKLTRKEQKELFIELGQVVQEAGECYAKMLRVELIEEMYNRLNELESKGDELQAKLDAHYSTQKNAPYLTLERAKLLRRIDDTLDNFAIAARTMHVFAGAVPSDFVERATPVSKLLKLVAEYVNDAIVNLFTNFSQALKLTGKIEDNRDKIVDLTFELETDYFKSLNGENAWKQFTAVERIMKRTAATVQRMRDTAEIIELMVYKFSAE